MKMIHLQNSVFTDTMFPITWAANLLQFMDVIWILLIIGLLFIGYKMYSYKVALEEAQKANAAMQKVFHMVSNETRAPLSQMMGELKNLMANAEQAEDKEQLFLIQQNMARLKKLIELADLSFTERQILEEETEACIANPFDLSFLKTQLSSITSQRKALSDFYKDSEQVSFHDKNHKINSSDKKLIEKFTSLIKEHIADENLNNDAIAGMLGLSRSLYYEKIKSLMGITPNEYLKNIRIREAARLLMEGDYAVSEVMLKVGFKDPKYFRNSFKKIYGKSPSEYTKFYQSSQCYH